MMNYLPLVKRPFRFNVYLFVVLFVNANVICQNQMATYAGNEGTELFNDVTQLSNGHFIVAGAADNLNWISPSVPVVAFSNPGITNTGGSSRTAFLLEFDESMQQIVKVFKLPAGAVEDFRFIKLTNTPGQITGSVYISGNTMQGYFIGKLDNNFVNGSPTGFSWIKNVGATVGEYPRIYQPWDVGGDGKVAYATGDSHSWNWSAIYRLTADGVDDIVNNWRVHWKLGGGEYYGSASDYPGGDSGLLYSAIVFKREPNRCDLRSTNQSDYDLWQPDGNGGSKKGKWPLDVLYNAPCVPGGIGNSTSGPGYTGYNPSSIFTYGPSSIAIDKRTNNMYIGFNAKSTLPDGGLPDFEPAVMAMDNSGQLLWWSRLYHEKRPDGTLQVSTPDQYVDAIAIDYSQPAETGNLVVGARCHGNNTENFWEGNTIAANASANGFQNNFTGNSGNIHISWLGKLSLVAGQLQNSTYMAERADSTTGLGTPHSDPNLDGWEDPNTGWPNVNTTYLRKNMLKVTADGSVVVLGVGRRTITTANAWQKMIKQGEGSSTWNQFVRVYTPTLSKPLYSSIAAGQWNQANGSGGDNVELMGVYKTAEGVVAVGFHEGSGGEIPTTGVPTWGNSSYSGQSAVLLYLKAENLNNPQDGYNTLSTVTTKKVYNVIKIFPNPANQFLNINSDQDINQISIISLDGKIIFNRQNENERTAKINVAIYSKGIYSVIIVLADGSRNVQKLVVQ